MVGGFDEADSKFTYPASCMEGQACPTDSDSGRTEFQRVGEKMAGPQAGALTTGNRKPKEEPSVLTTHDAGSTKKRWVELRSFCGSATPPSGKRANRCPVLSTAELLPFLWGRVSKNFPSDTPE